MFEEIFRQDNAFAFELQKNYIYTRGVREKTMHYPFASIKRCTLKYIRNILEHTLYYYY